MGPARGARVRNVRCGGGVIRAVHRCTPPGWCGRRVLVSGLSRTAPTGYYRTLAAPNNRAAIRVFRREPPDIDTHFERRATMTRFLRRLIRRARWLVALALAAAMPATVIAVVPVSYPAPALVPVDINLTPGDQFDAHVSGDWVSYTSDLRIRYYNFVTGIDAEIPLGGSIEESSATSAGAGRVLRRPR